jgi:hypothetical protein
VFIENLDNITQEFLHLDQRIADLLRQQMAQVGQILIDDADALLELVAHKVMLDPLLKGVDIHFESVQLQRQFEG